MAVTALSHPAFFWPVSQASQGHHNLPFVHGFLGHSGLNVSRLAKRLRVWAFG
jgi:hypothetical protein